MNIQKRDTFRIRFLIQVMRSDMPTMVRPKGKARKIAYAILGFPINLSLRSKKDRRVNERLVFEETSRVR
jgi:hypothetical protein